MCGRYALTLPPEAIRRLFGYDEQPNFPPRYNIAPTQPIAIVRAQRDPSRTLHRHFALVRWGLLPSWVKDPKAFPLIINARAEGIETKPSFRGAFRHRRCIVMADAFYEWQRLPASNGKSPPRPHLIRRRDGQTMAFAGLWEDLMGADGSQIETGCIITTAANGLMAGLHDRMPVILDHSRIGVWLDTQQTSPAEAGAMLKPARDDLLEIVEVGPAVNKAANEGPQLQEPHGPARIADGSAAVSQGTLF